MKKIDTTKFTPSAMLALGVLHAAEATRLTQLKASGNMRYDPVFQECEEGVQRMELDILRARQADAVVAAAGDLLAFVEELVERFTPPIPMTSTATGRPNYKGIEDWVRERGPALIAKVRR